MHLKEIAVIGGMATPHQLRCLRSLRHRSRDQDIHLPAPAGVSVPTVCGLVINLPLVKIRHINT